MTGEDWVTFWVWLGMCATGLVYGFVSGRWLARRDARDRERLAAAARRWERGQ